MKQIEQDLRKRGRKELGLKGKFLNQYVEEELSGIDGKNIIDDFPIAPVVPIYKKKLKK